MNGINITADFDIVSFVVAVAICFYTFTKYSEQSLGNRAFKRMAFCAALVCVTDYLSFLGVKFKFGSFWQMLLYSICVFSFGIFSQAVLAYTNSYIFTKDKAEREKKIAIRFFFPLMAAMLVVNAFTGFMFFIEDDYSISFGKAYVFLPAIPAMFAFISAFKLGHNAQKFTKYQIIVLCFLYETLITIPFVQVYICPTFRITPFVFVFLTTSLLLTIETPEDQALVSTISELEVLQRALKASVDKKTLEARERREKLERLTSQMTHTMAATIDAKDHYTSGHSARVARYAKMLAQKKGLGPEKCQQIFMMGILHDIGKVGVSSKIINKAGRLTDQEFAQMKSHPAIGSSILEKVSLLPELKTGARWHHERIDGRGYPDGLKGEQIPLEAKIIAVADAYDAMTSSRSYRQPMEQAAVREQIANGAGTQFDAEIAKLMLELIDEDKNYMLHEYKSKKEAQDE